MDRDALLVEREEHRLRLDAFDGETHEVGEPVGGVTLERDARDRPDAEERVAVPTVRLLLGGERRRQLAGGRAEADDRGDVLDPGATGALLGAADDERRDSQASTDEERAGALGASPRVRGHAHQVGAERSEVDGVVAGGGARVDVHEDAAGTCPGADVGNRLHDADLVVRQLDRHQCGARRDRVDDGGGREPAVAVDAHHDGLDRLAPARVEDARVLDRGGDDAGRVRRPADRPVHRGVHRLGAAGGEDDLSWARPHERGDLLARRLDGDPRDAAVRVHPARVGGVIAQVGHHGVERHGSQG